MPRATAVTAFWCPPVAHGAARALFLVRIAASAAWMGIARFRERRGHVAFWCMSLSMLGTGLSFGVAGVLQAYIERVMGLGFMTAQAQMRFWFAVTWVVGLILLVGVVLTVVDLLTLRPAAATAERA